MPISFKVLEFYILNPPQSPKKGADPEEISYIEIVPTVFRNGNISFCQIEHLSSTSYSIIFDDAVMIEVESAALHVSPTPSIDIQMRSP